MKKPPFYFDNEDDGMYGDSGLLPEPPKDVQYETVQFINNKEDTIALLHYVVRKAQVGEDGRYRVLLEERRTYSAAMYAADKADIVRIFTNEHEYKTWLRELALPSWATYKDGSSLM